MDQWKDKVAVVTGASSGIGASIVEKLAEAGVQVVGLARRVELVEELANKLTESYAPGKVFAIKCDVSKESEILEAFTWIADNLGTVHILVNNAGIIKNGSLGEGALEDWKDVFDVNVLGLCVATREALKLMKQEGNGGHIIHVNSIAGHYVPGLPDANVYPASKHAVTALAEALRQELQRYESKIKITSLSPGIVSTEIFNVGNFPSVELPALQPEDVANAVLYILATPPHVQVQELIIRPMGEPI